MKSESRRVRVSRKRFCSPTIRQNCLGLESPAILRVRSRNRTPSPPARSTAQRCAADESSVWMRLASGQLSRSVCIMISPTQSVSTASNSGCLPRTHQIANAPYEASGPAAENLTVAGLFIRHRRPVGSPKKSSGMRYLPFCCLVIHSRTYGSQFTSRISDASHRIKKSMPS
jgi:hypothetical protein